MSAEHAADKPGAADATGAANASRAAGGSRIGVATSTAGATRGAGPADATDAAGATHVAGVTGVAGAAGATGGERTAGSARRVTPMWTLAAIAILAAGLRLLGLTFGLPAVYNPDEVAIMSRSLAFATGDLNPHNFLYPTFYFYLLFAWIGGAFVVSWLAGLVPSVAAFQTLFFTDPTIIYVAGRLLGVTCGVITVLLTYVLAARFAGQFDGQFDARLDGQLAARRDGPFGGRSSGRFAARFDGRFEARATGLIAALFLAVAPTHVRDSHYVKHDVPVTLAIVLAQIAILRLLTAGSEESARPAGRARTPAVLAGAACGLACSVHYYAIFLAVPLLLALWLRERARGWPAVIARIADAGLAAAVVFFALSPFLLVEPGTAWQDIVANRQIVIDRAVATQQGLFANAGAYARMLWAEAIGWPVLLAALAGLVVATRERGRLTLLLVAFPAAFLLFISNTVAAGRYLNPVLPTLAVLAAVAVLRAASALAGMWTSAPRADAGLASDDRPTHTPDGTPNGTPEGTPPVATTTTARKAPRLAPRWAFRRAVRQTVPLTALLTGLLAALLAVPGALLSLRLGLFFRQADTRTLARQIIEREIPPGSTVLIQPYSVPLTQSRESLVEALRVHLGDPGRASRKFALRLALEPYPTPAYRTIFLGDGGRDVDLLYLSYRDLSGSDARATLRQAGVQYVVLKRYNVEDLAVAPLRAEMRQGGRLLASVMPYAAGADAVTRARVAPFLHNTDTPYDPALERPGPGIEVWQIAP